MINFQTISLSHGKIKHVSHSNYASAVNKNNKDNFNYNGKYIKKYGTKKK